MDQLYNIFTVALVTFYWVLVASVTLRVVLKKSAVSVSLSWLLVIYVLPVLGVVCYFLFGELNLEKNRAARARAMLVPFRGWFGELRVRGTIPATTGDYIYKIDKLCNQRMGIPALGGNELILKKVPEDTLNSIIQDIEQARSSIRMVFYIWNPAGLVKFVSIALIRAAKRGVDTKLLLDAAGSHGFLGSSWCVKMKQAGIQIVPTLEVNPLRIFLHRIDLRQHRKIIIIDESIAYTGSMNMVDPSTFRKSSVVGRWVDIMVRIKGPTVSVLAAIWAWDWEFETGERLLEAIAEPKTRLKDEYHPIQVVPSGPGLPENLILQVLKLAIHQSDESITITTPYFVPSADLLAALSDAAQRGIKVSIVIPYKNDSLMVKWASRSFYGELMESGVRIYEFYGGLLHTKSVVIDEKFCLVGTVNIDMRSLWLNFEVTLAIDDITFTQALSEIQNQYIVQSNEVIYSDWKRRPLYAKVLERLYYLFNPLL